MNNFLKKRIEFKTRGGTLAYWFYVEPFFLDYPKENQIFQQYAYEHAKCFDPYWPAEMNDVKNFGKSIIIPTEKSKVYKSEIFVLPCSTEDEKDDATGIIQKIFTLKDFGSFVRTWLVYQTLCENNNNSTADILDIIIESSSSNAVGTSIQS